MAKASKKVIKSPKATPLSKVSKPIEKKQDETLVEISANKSKNKQIKKELINVNVDTQILKILNNSDSKSAKTEAIKQIATQLGITSRFLHARKELLFKLPAADKQRIMDAQKVIL